MCIFALLLNQKEKEPPVLAGGIKIKVSQEKHFYIL
jgi:hypothetical protein